MPFHFSPNTTPAPQQIDNGSFAIFEGPDLDTKVGYVYSDVQNEWWVLRTAAPAYVWPAGPSGTSRSVRYECVDEQTFATPEAFYEWVETTAGWASSEYETIVSTCVVSVSQT